MSGIIKDLANNLDLTNALTPLIRTADVDSASIDLQQHNNGAFICTIGITGDTLSGSVYLECAMEESTDDSVWTAVADADVLNTVTSLDALTGVVASIDDNAEDDVVVLAEYTGKLRYIRMTFDFTGTHTNGIETAVIGVKSNQVELP